MIPQDRRGQLGTAFVLVAVVLFTVPALFPVQPMLVHDTDRSTNQPPAQIENEGVEILAYDDLSERGQEIYRRALESNGEYYVAKDKGAPEFDYPTSEEQAEAVQNQQPRPGLVVIERPVESDLPPADERYFGPRGGQQENINETRHRQQVMRYDMMDTRMEDPPLGATPQLLRLGAILVAIVSLGIGGYLLSSR